MYEPNIYHLAKLLKKNVNESTRHFRGPNNTTQYVIMPIVAVAHSLSSLYIYSLTMAGDSGPKSAW